MVLWGHWIKLAGLVINSSCEGGLGYQGKECGGITGAALWMGSATTDCMLEVPINDAIIASHSSALRVWLSVWCFGLWFGGGFPSFSHFSCIDTTGYRFTYCVGHPSNILLHLPGLSVRQFLMLSIVFNSVLVQSFCHDSSWVSESTWTHMVVMCSQWLEIIFLPEWYQCPKSYSLATMTAPSIGSLCPMLHAVVLLCTALHQGTGHEAKD